jgi:two-component system response regulator AtoC
MPKIVIADDDPAMVAVLSEVLRERGHDVLPAHNADRALELVLREHPDLVLTDIEMPQGDPTGLEVLRQTKEFDRAIPVIMITGHPTMEYTVQSLRYGAFDYLEKPFRIDEVLRRCENALFQAQAYVAVKENVTLKQQLQEKFRFDSIIGTSPAMENVFKLMSKVANTDSTVLILGESGTGKELVARALHYNSRRAAMPFMAVNCSALPEHLLESELFGHKKGAFTGAAFDKVGLFQHAEGGTIFLDEIASMSPGLQSKLLRFLQDKELRPVGDTKVIKVDVRVLAATNEPLQKKLEEGTFREDLYYRISVIPIELPPLRDRIEDIPLLVQHFLQTMAAKMRIETPKIQPETMEILRRCKWPGNVRELQNAIERAVTLCENGIIQPTDLPPRVLESVQGMAKSEPSATNLDEACSLKEYLAQQELRYIERMVAACGDDKAKAAKILGVSVPTVYRKLAEAGHKAETEQA